MHPLFPLLQEKSPLLELAYLILSILFLLALYLIGEFFRKRKHKAIQLAGYEVGLSDFSDRKEIRMLLGTAQFTPIKEEWAISLVLPILKGRRRDVEIIVLDFIARKDGPPTTGPKRMAVLLSIEENELAHCFIRPKSIGDKVWEGFQADVVPFPDQPNFDSKYLVTGYDAELVSAMLSPRVTDFLAAHPRLTIEVLPKRMLIFQADRKIKAEDLQPLLNTALALFKLLRESAKETGAAAQWQEYQEEAL